MKLEGTTALVTGASQGIGEAIAIRLAEEGADVVVNYHSHPEQADGVVRRIEGLGRRAIAVQADLGRVAEAGELFRAGVRQLGHVGVLVNNAGIEKRAEFLDVTEQDYDQVLNVNLKGVFFLTQAFVRHLREAARPGKIINVSSVHEELPFPHFATYCMAKGGLKMMTRDLAIELAPLGITVNSIAPGAIETPINAKLLGSPAQLNQVLEQIPLRRMGRPEDVAGVAAFLASRDADYITGATLFVDGGLLWNYSEQ
jgi:glucose 1-dehydrogenase